ncbi:MAG: hypothetical protein IIA64_11195 [Planctomycetes bacterium]|nr:hypothetical protein [Planctomycetota bacterium]
MPIPRAINRLAACGFALLTFGLAATAQTGDAPSPRMLRSEDLKPLAWRSIGPANMAGRVATIALAPGNPKTYFVGFATGGLWKTINNGTTFEPVFDDKETSSIGSVVVCDAPTNWRGWLDEKDELDEDADLEELGKAKIIWVGTGEGNGRNSSSWGHGVYRSTDGGAKFEHLGLEDSHDIPAIAVDPRNPDVCYVAALGHLWGANEMRGVYKTDDGGKTWSKSLYIDENTGACDVIIDPSNPDTVYAAMYMRRRTAYSFTSGGPQGGIYRSNDAGETWTKLTNGLPEQTGRIGLDIYRADPRIVYASVESDVGGKVGDSFGNDSRAGGVFRTDDGGDTWQRKAAITPRAFYFSRIRVDPKDDQRIYLPGWVLYVSDDGGETFRAGSAKVVHVDFHAMVIDPQDTDHILIGTDGGLYVSYDRGKTWDFHNHFAVGQFYNVAVDNSDPYRVGGGLQDNGSWIGPSENVFSVQEVFMGRAGAITNHDWTFVNWGDGFGVAFDPHDRNIIYAESQGGWLVRTHLDTGIKRTLKPQAKEGEPRFRFNWNAPFFISPHDSTTLYLGGNYVFKLTERGDSWTRISDDLSTRDINKVTTVGSEAETNGTVVSLAESPLQQGFLWAGTDDGLIHVTTEDGGTWTNVTPPEAQGLCVSKIEPSHHDRETAYVAIDGHRSDHFEPILLVTTDGGENWASILGDLPSDVPVKVVREDLVNPDVLYIGTERAAYVTIDRGEHWVKLNGESLPTVAVDDLAIQPREQDLVAGTHGRSIYILDDISPISQLTAEVVQSAFHVFESMPAQPRYYLDYGDLWSDRMFIADNPAMGGKITYWISEYADEEVEISIADATGHVLRKLSGTNRPGLNRVVWDLQPEEDQRLGNADNLPEFVAAGEYKVSITYGDHKGQMTITVLPAPGSDLK